MTKHKLYSFTILNNNRPVCNNITVLKLFTPRLHGCTKGKIGQKNLEDFFFCNYVLYFLPLTECTNLKMTAFMTIKKTLLFSGGKQA